MKHFLPATFIVYFIASIFLISCGGNNGSDPSEKNDPDKGKSQTYSGETKIDNGKYYFQGMIDHKYSVYMKFDHYNGELTGTYFYNSQKKELDLSGTVTEARLELDEMVKEKVTGHFSGKIYAMDSVYGIWKSPKGKELEFALYKSDEFDYSTHLDETERRWRPEDIEKFMESGFVEIMPPFEFDTEGESNEYTGGIINDEWVRMFINENYQKSPDDFEMNTYFYRYVIKKENYTAFIYADHYLPGAFGIDNTFLVLVTVSKKGYMIDSDYIGCNCFDSNMGSNDYFSTEDHFNFEIDGTISVLSIGYHGTLIEDETSTEPEKTETRNVITIDDDGNIESGK